MGKTGISNFLYVMTVLLAPTLVDASPLRCETVFSQTPLPIPVALNELFKEDATEFLKLKEQTIYPGIVDALEQNLTQQKISYLERVSKTKGLPYIVINTEGSSKINIISKEVFERWKITITLDPNFPSGALGSYEGINGKNIRGLMITRTFDDKRFLSNMHHEFLHAYLTNLEFLGIAHPLSLYFFRNPTLPYDGIQYGKYLPTQEFATFLRQGLVHSESTVKSLETLFDLTSIVTEFQNLKITQKTITKTHKGFEAVGIETNLGEFYIPKLEIETNKIDPDQIPHYLTEKIRRTVQIAQTIREVLKPSIEDLGGGIMILKPGLSEQESRTILLQIQSALFEKYPDLKTSLNDYIEWTDSFWKKVVLESNY